MNYDSAPWPSGPASYPPLPPPTRDETAFLEEIAALGEEWPQIMNERALRAEAIENRISNARLEASLPHFESFALDSLQRFPPDGLDSHPLPPPLPLESYHLEPHPNPQSCPSFLPPPAPSTLTQPTTYHASGYPQGSFVQQTYMSQQQLLLDHQPSTSSTPGSGSFDERGGEGSQFQTATSGTWRSEAPHTQGSRRASQWWEQPGLTAVRPSSQDYSNPSESATSRPYGLPSEPSATQPRYSQTSFTLPSQPQPSSTQYRPVPPLPYHPPSNQWNAALPASYSLWEQRSIGGQSLPPYQHYHEGPPSSSGSTNVVPAGLTYATASTPQSTDRSRQSSLNQPGDFGPHPHSGTTTSMAGVGKRTRFDSANYSRPPLDPQLYSTGTPSTSSQHASSSSSSSLPTTSSLDIPKTSVSPVPPPPIHPTAQVTSATGTRNSSTVTGNRRGTKSKVEVPIFCVSCGTRIARLILRGQRHELEVPYETTFHCLACSPPAAMATMTGDSPSDRSPSDSPHTYTNVGGPGGGGGGGGGGVNSRRASTTSDRSNPSTSTTGPSTPLVPTTFRKKNKRLDVGQATLTACDVCLMDRATGSVLPKEPERGFTINFQIEVVCSSCDEKYQRCSDCGGGGGVRLGTGKWRSKELFKDGKKTCSLRHQRLGAFPEMEYQVWKNTDLPREELEEISEKCGELFANQMLGAIAIPEVLERNGAIWTSFAEAQSHAYSGWRGMDPMIRYNVEPSQGIRRYLALRLCAPNLRKTHRKAEMPAPIETPRSGIVFKGDKEIVGYIIAEWDMHKGVLFLALVIPWDATGEAYDATTLLLQALCTRVQQDQQEENRQRESRGQVLLPKLERVFTMLFFKTGSRMITQLTKKRGFAPIDEYLASNPRADPLAFPPHRPIYLPNERQQGWLVLIRTLRENADGTIDDWSARRSADEERGKRKEARAKLAREKKEKNKEPRHPDEDE